MLLIILNDMQRAAKRKQAFQCWSIWMRSGYFGHCSVESFSLKNGCLGSNMLFPVTLERSIRMKQSRQRVSLLVHSCRKPPTSSHFKYTFKPHPHKKYNCLCVHKVFLFWCKWGSLWCQSKQTFLLYTSITISLFNGIPLTYYNEGDNRETPRTINQCFIVVVTGYSTLFMSQFSMAPKSRLNRLLGYEEILLICISYYKSEDWCV